LAEIVKVMYTLSVGNTTEGVTWKSRARSADAEKFTESESNEREYARHANLAEVTFGMRPTRTGFVQSKLLMMRRIRNSDANDGAEAQKNASAMGQLHGSIGKIVFGKCSALHQSSMMFFWLPRMAYALFAKVFVILAGAWPLTTIIPAAPEANRAVSVFAVCSAEIAIT
jgi:hypothetical protein